MDPNDARSTDAPGSTCTRPTPGAETGTGQRRRPRRIVFGVLGGLAVVCLVWCFFALTFPLSWSVADDYCRPVIHLYGQQWGDNNGDTPGSCDLRRDSRVTIAVVTGVTGLVLAALALIIPPRLPGSRR